MSYTCTECGKVHEEWPALAFSSPMHYNDLTDEEKQQIAEIGNDWCIIHYEDETDRFIRVTMTQMVIDDCNDLEYGLWVSLSEKSYKDYADNYNNPDHEAQYFGWLCNRIPQYEDTENSIPTTVFTRRNKQRPEIVPHEDCDHPLVRDYYNGITKAEAEKRIADMMAAVNKQKSGE